MHSFITLRIPCRFTKAVLEVQQRAALKTALLEAKLKNMEGRDLGPREMHVRYYSLFYIIISIILSLYSF